MNAIVQFQGKQPTVPDFTMSDMERVALAIAKGGLFGSSDPNAVLTLCMLAQAEGQHPAVVFRDYHIISGKPAKKAEAMQRDFLGAGGKIEWHRLDDECADATFSHPAGGTARISWDKARVAQAQLGGNAMHKKYPRQMLRSRVISEGVRTVFPSATSGLYETGEVQDMATQDAPRTPPVPQAQRARDITPVTPALTDERSPGRIKAEDWTADHIAALNDAATLDVLDDVIAAGAKAVAKLGRDHSDLHDKVRSAETARAMQLQPTDAAGSSPQSAEPVAADETGRGDGDMGEAFTTEDAEADILAHLARKELVSDVNSLVSSRKDELDEAGQDRLLEAASARIAELRGRK